MWTVALTVVDFQAWKRGAAIGSAVKSCGWSVTQVLGVMARAGLECACGGSGWRRGILVSGVRRINEVNARWAPLGGHRAGIPSRYVTGQLGQLSLASLRGRLIEYQLRLG